MVWFTHSIRLDVICDIIYIRYCLVVVYWLVGHSSCNIIIRNKISWGWVYIYIGIASYGYIVYMVRLNHGQLVPKPTSFVDAVFERT